MDLSKPAYRLGVAEIRVTSQAHHIDVQVRADKDSYPVRGKAQVTIEAKLPDGRPAAGADVALAVVDQALLELMPNRSWDLLGAMLQLIVSSIGLVGLGFDYRMKINWRNKGFRQVLRLLPPRSLDQGIDYVNGIVEMNLASRMGDGIMRAYQQASALSLMPVNLIGVAISNAAFPSMTERLAEGRIDLFKQELRQVLRWIICLALPIAVVTFFARGYIATFIKEGGNALIAGLLGALVVSILFRTVYHIAARTFYAQQDTKTPLYISLFTITLNIVLAFLFSMQFGWGPYGLAWAQSIVAVVEVAILFVILQRKTPGIFNKYFRIAVGKMLIASAIMAVVTYVTLQFLQLRADDQGLLATLPKFAAITAVSFTVYVIASKKLKLDEAEPVVARVSAIVFGRRR